MKCLYFWLGFAQIVQLIWSGEMDNAGRQEYTYQIWSWLCNYEKSLKKDGCSSSDSEFYAHFGLRATKLLDVTKDLPRFIYLFSSLPYRWFLCK
jgi:hypothetical protein